MNISWILNSQITFSRVPKSLMLKSQIHMQSKLGPFVKYSRNCPFVHSVFGKFENSINRQSVCCDNVEYNFRFWNFYCFLAFFLIRYIFLLGFKMENFEEKLQLAPFFSIIEKQPYNLSHYFSVSTKTFRLKIIFPLFICVRAHFYQTPNSRCPESLFTIDWNAEFEDFFFFGISAFDISDFNF